MKPKAYYVKVESLEHSKALQKAAFKLGYVWAHELESGVQKQVQSWDIDTLWLWPEGREDFGSDRGHRFLSFSEEQEDFGQHVARMGRWADVHELSGERLLEGFDHPEPDPFELVALSISKAWEGVA